jgi:hypothetical protein
MLAVYFSERIEIVNEKILWKRYTGYIFFRESVFSASVARVFRYMTKI